MKRDKLPYRKNCEGYFIKDNKILARDSKQGYVIFPGGGIEKKENPEEAILRETLEETGARIKNIKEICSLKIIWDDDWAKTEKQKERYRKYQGDEMYFFTGNIINFENFLILEEDSWKEEKLMELKEVIEIIEKGKPFNKNSEEYHEMQIQILKKLTN